MLPIINWLKIKSANTNDIYSGSHFNYSFNPCSDLLIQSNIYRQLAFYPGDLPTLNYPHDHLEGVPAIKVLIEQQDHRKS